MQWGGVWLVICRWMGERMLHGQNNIFYSGARSEFFFLPPKNELPGLPFLYDTYPLSHSTFCHCCRRCLRRLCPRCRQSQLCRIILHTVSLVVSFFENPSKIMACGTLRLVVIPRIRTDSSTLFICAALFFGMLGKGLYSVETD